MNYEASERLRTTAEAERLFISEYRFASVKWAFYGAVAGATAFAVFLLVAVFDERHSDAAIRVRQALIFYLVLIAWTLHFRREAAARFYVTLVGSTSAIALFGTVILIQLAPERIVTPAIMFGLFLHYACLRLPLTVASLIGWLVAFASALLTPSVAGGNETVRTLLYLILANVSGMVVCRYMEMRERELFLQRREAEAARGEARERAAAAEEANRQKTRLIAAVSHDLRQPMTAAVAHLDLLRSRLECGDSVGAQVQADRAVTAVGMLGATLDHLLTAARYDSGTEAMKIETVDLAPLLRRLRDDYQPDALTRGIELRLRLPRRRVLVCTDMHSLHRVLGNLVANALKFTDAAGRSGRGAVIRARFRDNRCRIDVVDTGLGIAPEHGDAIWEPYLQIDNAERNRERGLGLGLFLVRRIIEQLPGHAIRMQSTLGRGSRFSVELPATTLAEPLVDPLRAPADEPSPPVDRKALRGAYVLLLEDDHEARLSLQDLFDDWGLVYASGATLKAVLASHDDSERLVDAIVCDYRLPGNTNGIECIAQLRSRLGYSPRAILITGEPDVEAIRAAVGPDTLVLHKPFATHALAAPLVEAARAMRQAEETPD